MIKDPIHPHPKTTCYHCGEDVIERGIHLQEKEFCCTGCKTVYEILNQNNLCEYYSREAQPGINQKQHIREGKFGFLDDQGVTQKLLHFQQEEQCHVIFYLPQMHCSSCIWLLENLPKVNQGILKSEVDFIKKEVRVIFDQTKTSLRKVAETLTMVGYEPHISLQDVADKKISKHNRSRIVKIGIAGFCFGNIMMLSFPEYFSLNPDEHPGLNTWFSALNVLLSLPIFFYCANEFFESAYKGLRQKFLNIDAPIALAIVITFARSIYEIVSGSGAGYLDSMSGIVFFMLVGRYFQDKTYQNLSFERDYKSYFPLGVTLLEAEGLEKQIPVSELKPGNRIKIHHGEIIPADSILFMGKASIDYSFVSGESLPVEKSIGEILYAGGKQCGGAIELEVVKEISQSYLTRLWNNDTFKQEKERDKRSFIHYLSRYFTYILFSIAFFSTLYWQLADATKTWQVLTAVLIVACPCALLLSATFTNGNMLHALGGKGIYVKNAGVLEDMSTIDTIVFDKTGTITEQIGSEMVYKGEELSDYQKQMFRTLAAQSNHPLSKGVYVQFPASLKLKITSFWEEKGKGVSAIVDGHALRMGSSEWVKQGLSTPEAKRSSVYLVLDDEVLGFFEVNHHYRSQLKQVVDELKQQYTLAVVSGDNNAEEQRLQKLFGDNSNLLFNRQPQDKLEYIKRLQEQNHTVMMVGDGLNDAGALRQSDIGIAISDNTNTFSPSCDVIFSGRSFALFGRFILFCKRQKHIIYASFILSILYNIVGLYFAVSGQLQPVIAAILMPISSVSIVLFTSGATLLLAKKLR
ncbi:MAG: heavy metal translocating P-type ATPase metal-binding domain-containing protein [Bacteroidia bacterium]|jgi:Cu+-exporting ATPase|nr:heavy metal translocating P-type ATPase metal-binding domain-containing protein [Bacteroidia bacterium]